MGKVEYLHLTLSVLIMLVPLCFEGSHTRWRRTIQNDTNQMSSFYTFKIFRLKDPNFRCWFQKSLFEVWEADVNDDWLTWTELKSFFGETAPIGHWPGWDKFEGVADLRFQLMTLFQFWPHILFLFPIFFWRIVEFVRGGRARIFEMVSLSQMVSWMISGNSWAISDHLSDDTKFLRIAATANSHSFSLWLSCSSYNQPHCLAYV